MSLGRSTGVHAFAPDGTKIGRISLPERCANVCFGGLKRNRLFMAASQSLYALYVNTQARRAGEKARLARRTFATVACVPTESSL